MLELPKFIEPLFYAAGWKPSKSTSIAWPITSSATECAHRIIDEFHGLAVGECGPGTETGASDVQFYVTLRAEAHAVVQRWEKQIGCVVAFASAHRGHMILLVGPNRAFYLYTDPDDRLYSAGNNFGELMRCMLWGDEFGPEIAKDLDRLQ